MPKADAELIVIEKTQVLLVWTLNHIAQFPRSHRYGIGLRLETRMSDILDLLLRAKYTKDRLPLLLQTNVELELLRFQFRTVKDIRCLSVESYEGVGCSNFKIGRPCGVRSTHSSPGQFFILECGGSTPLSYFSSPLAGERIPKCQSGVEPPHSKPKPDGQECPSYK